MHKTGFLKLPILENGGERGGKREKGDSSFSSFFATSLPSFRPFLVPPSNFFLGTMCVSECGGGFFFRGGRRTFRHV